MFTKGEILQFLERMFGDYKLTNNGLNACFFCPSCNDIDINKKKFVIETIFPFRCHCWKCGLKGKTLFYVIKKYKGKDSLQEYIDKFSKNHDFFNCIDEKEEINSLNAKKIELPFDFRLLAEINEQNLLFEASKPYIEYLKNRNVFFEDLWYFRIGFAPNDEKYKNRIILPSFDENGELNYFTTRAIYPKMKLQKLHCDFSKENIIFNEINIDWKKELILTEGPFDLITCKNYNSTCLLGSLLNKEHLLFQKIIENNTPIILALDSDATKKTFCIAKLLLEYDIKVKILTTPSNFEDIGSMKKEIFDLILPSATMFTTNNFLRYKIESI